MPRKIETLHCTPETRRQLKWVAESAAESPKVVQRAQMILLTLDGKSPQEIIDALRVSRSVYFRWRGRFEKSGIMGLWDHPHPGKPPVYDAEFENHVLSLLKTQPPSGQTRWDCHGLAQALHASDDAVWRVLRRHHVTLVRQREWQIGPCTVEHSKGRRILGVYISPPVWMVALADQELEDAKGWIITRDRKAYETIEKEAQKQRCLPFDRAIEIMSGISYSISDSKRQTEVMSFLRDIASGRHENVHVEVISYGNLSFRGMGQWKKEHPWMEFIVIDGTEEDQKMIAPPLPAKILEFDLKTHARALKYPAAAISFVWEKYPSPDGTNIKT